MKGSDGVPGDEAVFREAQRFRQPWLWALVIVGAGFAWFTFIYELFGSLSPDNEGGPVWLAAIILLLVGLGLPALFISARLVVEVRRDGLYYRYYPFHRHVHKIGCDEIKTAEARTYSPIKEYGGWGIRGAWKRGTGKAYNVYGNRGLQLELVDGRRILFGSQHADDFAFAVAQAMRK